MWDSLKEIFLKKILKNDNIIKPIQNIGGKRWNLNHGLLGIFL